LDYNRDGHLDLFVSNYLQFDFNMCLSLARTAIAIGREFRSSAVREDCRRDITPYIAITATALLLT
jgi:hypothetical protein